VFILKKVKVVCFDTLLQVLILKYLHCAKIVDSGLLFICWTWIVAASERGVHPHCNGKSAQASETKGVAERLLSRGVSVGGDSARMSFGIHGGE
jgi:hypothetical protein